MFADDPEVIAVVSEWVQKAENDLVAAVQIFKLGKRAPTDTVCFHAQQCVEKYIKALLINHGVDFPKTHNISSLILRLPLSARPALSLNQQELMTRYPGDVTIISVTEARAALKLARRVRQHARTRLPKAVLRLK